MKKPTKTTPQKPLRITRRWGIVGACAVLLIALAGSWGFAQSRGTNEQSPSKISDPSEGGKYLVIKEWGVRFELPGEIRGRVAYRISYDRSKSGSLFFYSPKLAKQTANCQADWGKELAGIGLRFSRAHRSLYKNFPDDAIRNYTVNDMKYGHIRVIGDFSYGVGFADYPNGADSEEEEIAALSKIPIGCYQTTYPNAPNTNDPVWQESQTIYRMLEPATFTLEKVPKATAK